jgi:hypothetical protein
MVVTTKYAGVTITRGAEWQDNLTSATPDQWPEIIAEYQWYCRHVLPGDCRNLLHMVREGEATGWAGYDDRETYLREGLGLDPEAVDWALRGLEIVAVNKPVAFKEAQKLGGHGGDRRSEQAKVDQGSDATLIGRGAAYLTARLRKEGFDELANAVAAKTLSARAAAREAGIIIPPTPLTIIRRAWKRMTPADRETFLREIAS